MKPTYNSASEFVSFCQSESKYRGIIEKIVSNPGSTEYDIISLSRSYLAWIQCQIVNYYFVQRQEINLRDPINRDSSGSSLTISSFAEKNLNQLESTNTGEILDSPISKSKSSEAILGDVTAESKIKKTINVPPTVAATLQLHAEPQPNLLAKLSHRQSRSKSSIDPNLAVISRMCDILLQFISHNYISMTETIDFLYLLFSDGAVLRSIPNFNWSPSSSSLIKSHQELELCVCTFFLSLYPFISSLGSSIIRKLVSCSTLQLREKCRCDDLMNLADDLECMQQFNALNSSTDDHHVFMRDGSEDNRNDHKTQVDAALFNERESCFDEFSHLFHTQRSLVHVQLQSNDNIHSSGSQLKPQRQPLPNANMQSAAIDFAQSYTFVSHQRKILTLNDVNFTWFTDLFVKMLVHYGTQTDSFVSTSRATSSSQTNFSSTAKKRISASPSASLLSNTNNPFSYPISAFSSQAFVAEKVPPPAILSPDKLRKLEERLGTVTSASHNGVTLSPSKPIPSQPTQTMLLSSDSNGKDSAYKLGAFPSQSVHSTYKASAAILPKQKPSISKLKLQNTIATSSSGLNSFTASDSSPSANTKNQCNLGSRLDGLNSTSPSSSIASLSSPSAHGRSGVVMNNCYKQSSPQKVSYPNKSNTKPSNRYINPSSTNASSMMSGRNPNLCAGLYTSAERLFPENEQFFFYYVLAIDSPRFNKYLSDSILNEISLLTDLLNSRLETTDFSNGDDEISTSVATQSITFTLRIKKLRLLGKFLGLIEFYYQWPIQPINSTTNNKFSNNASSGIKLPERSEDQAHKSKRFSLPTRWSRSLPLDQELIRAWDTESLTVTVPWVAEFLQIMAEDNNYRIASKTPYRQCIQTLKSIQTSSLYNISSSTLSSNRVYVLYEIQRIGNFFTDFSTLRHIPINLASTGTTSVPKVAGKSATIDCRRDAFSTTFIKSEMPELMVSNIEERVETQIVHQNCYKICMDPSQIMDIDLTRQPTPASVTSTNVFQHTSNSSSIYQTPIKSHLQAHTVSSVSADSIGKSSNTCDIIDVSPTSSRYPLPTNRLNSPGSLERIPANGNVASSSHRPMNILATEVNSMKQNSKALSSLQSTFWQRHPHQYQIYLFILDLVQNASTLRLKEMIAACVRDLWAQSKEISNRFKRLSSETAAISLTTSTDFDRVNSEANKQHNTTFEKELEASSKLIENKLMDEASVFLTNFVETFLKYSLRELCRLSPDHSNVADLAVYLIKQQISAQNQPLLQFVKSYSQRKLQEVRDLSTKQFIKSFENKLYLNDVSDVSNFQDEYWCSTHSSSVSLPTFYRNSTPAISAHDMAELKLMHDNEKLALSNHLALLSSYFKIEPVNEDLNTAAVSNEYGVSSLHRWECKILSLHTVKSIRDTTIADVTNCGSIINELLKSCGRLASLLYDSNYNLDFHAINYSVIFSSFFETIFAMVAEKDSPIIRDQSRMLCAKVLTMYLPVLIYANYICYIMTRQSRKSVQERNVSSILSSVYDMGLVSMHSIVKILSSCSRKSTLTYYESCYGLSNYTKIGKFALLYFTANFANLRGVGLTVEACKTKVDGSDSCSSCLHDSFLLEIEQKLSVDFKNMFISLMKA